jgi:hypothetical protein
LAAAAILMIRYSDAGPPKTSGPVHRGIQAD